MGSHDLLVFAVGHPDCGQVGYILFRYRSGLQGIVKSRPAEFVSRVGGRRIREYHTQYRAVLGLQGGQHTVGQFGVAHIEGHYLFRLVAKPLQFIDGYGSCQQEYEGEADETYRNFLAHGNALLLMILTANITYNSMKKKTDTGRYSGSAGFADSIRVDGFFRTALRESSFRQ